MNQTLEQLIKLQEIDHRLLEIKSFMGDLPLTVEGQEAELLVLESNIVTLDFFKYFSHKSNTIFSQF